MYRLENKISKYDNVISLGFFCGVAQETERLGLRSKSMPLDWVISTSFVKVIDLIDNGFVDYVNDLYYFDDCSNRVDNDNYCIQFFHDFIRKEPLENQITSVKDKYSRRIKQFKLAIHSPTLFIRYIADDNEFEWIKHNHSRIDNAITRDNSNNKIIFIGHYEPTEDFGYDYYQVQPDKDDVVARRFTEMNRQIYELLCNDDTFDKRIRRKNKTRYYWHRFKKLLRKFSDKGRQILNKIKIIDKK